MRDTSPIAYRGLHFADAGEWRRWLQKNSGTAREVWLEHFKKRSGKVSISLEEAVEEALCFGWIDGKLISIDKDRFLLRYSPRKDDSVWSQINKDRIGRLIAQGRMTPAGLAKVEEAKKYGQWDAAYTSKTGDEVPPDLAKALVQNPTAKSNFEKFANTYRNMYIGWITSAKTEETRKKRVVEVVERSASNKKPGS